MSDDPFNIDKRMTRKGFEEQYHVSFDPASPYQDSMSITKTVRNRINLPEIYSEVKVSRDLFRHSDHIDDSKQIVERCKRDIVESMISKLIEMGIVRIVNMTENVLRKHKEIGNLTPKEQGILDEYEIHGTITLIGFLDIDNIDHGYTYDDFNSIDKLNPEWKYNIDEEDASFIWKLLPPRINGIDDSKHPLQPGWMGSLPRGKDTHIIEKVKRILNK